VQKNSYGFTLLELIVVIAIIGILAVTVAPLFRGRESQLRTKEFVAKLNALMQVSWQQALVSQKVQRVYFDFRNKKILLEEQKDIEGKDFVPIKSEFLDTQMEIPSTYFFKNFYIEGKDEMLRKVRAAYFYIVPSGLAQTVIINIIDQGEELKERESEKFGLVLNPFSAQFEYYDTFQKP